MALQIQPFVGTDVFTMDSFNKKISDINTFVNTTATEVEADSTEKYSKMQNQVAEMGERVTAMGMKVDNAVANAISVPIGGIVIWSGSVDSIPTHWHLCDGTNGTVNLRDRFILGAGGNYGVGAIGGETSHTLTVEEIPSHSHNIKYNTGTADGSGQVSPVVFGSSTPYTRTSSESGGGAAHNNMPPYYALCYIQRIA